MPRLDRKDVILVIVIIVVALLGSFFVGFLIDQSSRAGAAAAPGGHVPFTDQPVTPGDPSSYVDTVGQCPFYEMAGAKGCVVPPGIVCNADWSVCSSKDESIPVLDNQSPLASSQAVKVSNCKE